MSTQESIEKKLLEAFEPIVLQVENESYKHSVPENSETHFHVVIVSDSFVGLRLIERQRKVNDVLSVELQNGVHALSQRTFTPDEWRSRGGDPGTGSPHCQGAKSSD